LPARGLLGRWRDALLGHRMRRIFQKALPALNAARRGAGFAPARDVYEQLPDAPRMLVQASPVFDFTSPHMPRHVSYAGPELQDPTWSSAAGAPRWRPPFAQNDLRPLVLVGLSSAFQNQVATLRRIVAVLSSLEVRARC
jgi:UDP:flavonoid glycosyltransferase YjiC (YdhE family)